MIDSALDYQRLAELHRPRDESQLAIAARDLAIQGLTEHDIASALRLTPGQTRALLTAGPKEVAALPHSAATTMMRL